MAGANFIVVSSRHSGEKLYQFIEKQVKKQIPRSAIMKWIRTGQVRVDGKRAKPFQRIYEGQKIRVPPHQTKELPPVVSKIEPNPFLLKIVYEDTQVMVLEKPPNLPTQPGKGIEDSVYHRLKKMYGEEVPYLVHRLDKETSGLLLVAKTYSSLRHLQNLWRKNKIKKVYLAWVAGITRWRKWRRLEDIFMEERDSAVKEVKAISMVKTLKAKGNKSLVGVYLVTGRKHQIRIQMSKRSFPIIGERKYAKIGCPQGLLLHSTLLIWDNKHLESIPPWLGEFKVGKNLLSLLYPLP